MAREKFDKSGKFLLEHHGTAVMHVAGAKEVVSTRTVAPESVQLGELPDGLLEVWWSGQTNPTLTLIEVATYPEKRIAKQMHDDLVLTRQARGVMPDAVVFVLKQEGDAVVPDRFEETSEHGWSSACLTWKVVPVWKLEAERLLEDSQVGAVPWAVLAHYSGRPEILFQRCRDRIDKEGGNDRNSLLAATQIFATLNHQRPDLLSILGGRNAMIESPLLKELEAEFRHDQHVKVLLETLKARFNTTPPNVQAGLQLIKDEEALLRLTRAAVLCDSLVAFEVAMNAELPVPPPKSTRGGKRRRKPEQ